MKHYDKSCVIGELTKMGSDSTTNYPVLEAKSISYLLTYLLTYLHYLLTFWKKKSAISGICRDISEILTDSESAFKTGQFEHL